MKKRGMVAVVTIAVFACLLLCTPVSAQGNSGAGCTSETKYYGTINGGMYFEQYGWMQIGSMTKTFDNVPEGIKFARVYTGVWAGSPGKGGDFNITIQSATGSYTTATYKACDPCPVASVPPYCAPYQSQRCDALNDSINSPWNDALDEANMHDYITGCGVHFISYNATPYIIPGSNTVTVKTVGNQSCPRGKWDGRIYLIALLVVYEDTNMPEMTYWINEGAPYMEKDSYCDGLDNHYDISFYFNGTYISNPAKVKYWTLGFPHAAYASTEPAYTKLNGNDIGEYDDMEKSGGYEILYRWDNIPASYLNTSSNLFCYHDPSPVYERVNVAVLMVEPDKPDLNVSGSSVNCEYLFGNESNNISATVKNNGTVDASAFNVSFSIDGFSKEVSVDGRLTAGANTTVCVTDPTLRNAGDSVTITVTADSNGEVAESDETNNEMNISKTVVNNGYKGKRYTGGDDITTWKTFDLVGNLLYSLGDSYYASGSGSWTTYNASWSASDLPVPGTATIEEARLYVMYTWDKSSAGNITDYFSMNFNGNAETPDVHHSDEKMYPNSYPYGMLAYNVTTNFGVGGNVANLTSSYPGGGKVSMRGMLLVVVYADDSEPKRKIIVNEGFDLLYGGSSKCTNPEEATAWAPFGAMDLSAVESATLITVAPGAGYPYYPDEGELLFNDHIWYNVWNETNANGAQIGIDERNVTLYLQSTDNEAGFQSSSDWMEASNAFLVITYKEAAVPIFDTGTPANPYPSIFGTHNGTITVDQNITVNRIHTYPCSGTGGHTEYIKIWNETTGDCAEAHWDGYIGDYHNISFDWTLILKKGVIYNYTIRTGSYPQIHHRNELEVDGGIIRCTKFTDANGKVYYNWIPAIKLY
jgi:hypothetical protein